MKQACNEGALKTPDGLCQPCARGYFLRDDHCEPCQGDSIAPFEGAVECTPCGSSETSSADHTSCLRLEPLPPRTDRYDCSPGTYFNADKEECRRCPRNTISYMRGQLNCIRCVGEVESNAERTACVTVCPKGKYLSSKGSCESCPSGTAKTKRGSGPCSSCRSGTKPNTKQTMCVPLTRQSKQPQCVKKKQPCKRSRDCCGRRKCKWNQKKTKKLCRKRRPRKTRRRSSNKLAKKPRRKPVRPTRPTSTNNY